MVANNKGGCGKSTIVTSLSQIIDCDIVDHDNQGTLRVSSSFTDRNKPVESDKVSKPIVIHDIPPYNSLETKALIEAKRVSVLTWFKSYLHKIVDRTRLVIYCFVFVPS